jgi:hypothetical protein
VRRFLVRADGAAAPALLDRASVTAFTADLLEPAASRQPARARQLALRRFSAWLLEEGESDADPLLGLEAAKLDAKVIEPLSPEQIKALVAACAGKDLRDRRDEALVRLMIETSVRTGEVVALGTEDVDLSTGRATVRRSEGVGAEWSPSARRPPGRWTATSVPPQPPAGRHPGLARGRPIGAARRPAGERRAAPSCRSVTGPWAHPRPRLPSRRPAAPGSRGCGGLGPGDTFPGRAASTPSPRTW